MHMRIGVPHVFWRLDTEQLFICTLRYDMRFVYEYDAGGFDTVFSPDMFDCELWGEL